MCKAIRYLPLFLLLVMVAACGPAQSGQPNGSAPLAWIDTPLDGSSLPLAPVDVMFHGADPTGIAQFELSVNDAVIGTYPGPSTDALVYIHQPWTPAAPGVFTIKVRAQNPAGAWSDYATVTVTILGQDIQPTALAQLTATPAPGQPNGSVNKNTVCRSGPSLQYAILLYLNSGTPANIVGRNQDGTWWLIVRPDGYGNCWIPGTELTISGNTGSVPVVQVAEPTALPTALPTEQPTQPFNCAQFQDQNSCNQYANYCQWSPNNQTCQNK